MKDVDDFLFFWRFLLIVVVWAVRFLVFICRMFGYFASTDQFETDGKVVSEGKESSGFHATLFDFVRFLLDICTKDFATGLTIRDDAMA